MKYSKLITENHNYLFVKSMNKIHRITHLAFNEAGHKVLFEKHQLVTVSKLPDIDHVELMAAQYGGDNTFELSDLSTPEQPYLGMYMQAYDGNYYQIAGVFQDIDKANDFMCKRPDTALIDSTKFKALDHQYHFIASLKKSKHQPSKE